MNFNYILPYEWFVKYEIYMIIIAVIDYCLLTVFYDILAKNDFKVLHL